MGRKVSDEFTVPLCRIHHRAVHHAGREAAWWEGLDIDVVEIARNLWQESHDRQRSAPSALTTAPD
jgi:gentisate 1,2-dioxygenase